MAWVIYEILNAVTGNRYIGRTRQLRKRMIVHRSLLNRGLHRNVNLQLEWTKYGEERFRVSELASSEEEQDSIRIEEAFIAEAIANGNAYNISRSGKGGDVVHLHPNKEEVLKNYSESKRKTESSLSDEARERRRQMRIGESNPFYGKHHSDDSRKRMSESRKRKGIARFSLSEEHRRNLSRSIKEAYRIKRERAGFTESVKKTSLGTKKKYGAPTKSRSKTVIINGVEYQSIVEAARIVGMNRAAITYRIRSDDYPEFSFG